MLIIKSIIHVKNVVSYIKQKILLKNAMNGAKSIKAATLTLLNML